eukprot:COSAG06_NODE_4287_length_4398_cov_17.464061_5_plen_61_part_00
MAALGPPFWLALVAQAEHPPAWVPAGPLFVPLGVPQPLAPEASSLASVLVQRRQAWAERP